MQSRKFPKIKLITNTKIRLIHQVPSSLSDLHTSISQLTKVRSYTLTTDTGKSLRSDFDLQESLKLCQNKVSLRIFLHPEPSPGCSNCGSASYAPIYNCPECNVFLCPSCESQTVHQHALIKGNSFAQVLNFQVNRMNPTQIFKDFQKYEKNLIKGKVLSHLLPKNFRVKSGENFICGWVIINCGDIDWPEGSALVWKKGDLKSNGEVFGPVSVGQMIELKVNIKAPEQIGKFSGNWEVFIRGHSVLSLKEVVSTVQTSLE